MKVVGAVVQSVLDLFVMVGMFIQFIILRRSKPSLDAEIPKEAEIVNIRPLDEDDLCGDILHSLDSSHGLKVNLMDGMVNGSEMRRISGVFISGNVESALKSDAEGELNEGSDFDGALHEGL
jgi:hypothetical protein